MDWDWLCLTVINSVIMICFTVLAVVFDRWWIILFSALFLYYSRK